MVNFPAEALVENIYCRSFSGELLLHKFYWRNLIAEGLLQKFYCTSFTGEIFTAELQLCCRTFHRTIWFKNIIFAKHFPGRMSNWSAITAFNETCMMPGGSIFLDNSTVSETKVTIALAATKVSQETLVAMLLYGIKRWDWPSEKVSSPRSLSPASSRQSVFRANKQFGAVTAKGICLGPCCFYWRGTAFSKLFFSFNWFRRLNVTLLWMCADNSCFVWRSSCSILCSQAR